MIKSKVAFASVNFLAGFLGSVITNFSFILALILFVIGVIAISIVQKIRAIEEVKKEWANQKAKHKIFLVQAIIFLLGAVVGDCLSKMLGF